MGKANLEKAGINFDKMWAHNDDEHWAAKGREVFEIFRKAGVPSSTPDWVNFPYDSDMESCCGIDEIFPTGYNRFTFQHACAVLKRKGIVTWQDMLNAEPQVHTKEEFDLVKRLWNDVDEHFYGMRDLYDRFFVNYSGEDNEGMAIWKMQRPKNDVLKLFG